MYSLSDSLPYLLNRLGARLGNLFGERIAPLGLTVPMYRVLATLLERSDLKLNELSAVTTIELSTMSRLIGKMAADGLVTRSRAPDDDRAVHINLTRDGRKVAEQARELAEHYDIVAASVLRPAELKELKRILVRMYDALDVLEEELVDPRQARRASHGKAAVVR